MSLKRTEDRVIKSTGSIIFYSKPRVTHLTVKNCILCQCGDCKAIRLIQNPRHKYAKGFTGLCRNCSNERINAKQCGPRHGMWKDGKTLSKEGYVYLHHSLLSQDDCVLVKTILTNHGYVLEHRLVMAKRINRPLSKHDVVHHMNGIKDDNRSENLMLVDSSHHLEENKIINALKQRICELKDLSY